MAAIENELLHIMSTYEDYKKYRLYVPEQVLSPVGQQVLKRVDDYWKAYSERVSEFDWPSFSSWLETCSSTKDPNLKAMQQICAATESVPHVTVARDVLDRAVERDVAERIIESVDEALSDATPLDTGHILTLVNELSSFRGSDLEKNEYEVSTDIEEVLEASHVTDDGLPFSLECLQMSAGPLRPGDTVYVPARPESGKTTFLVQQAGYMMDNSANTTALIFSNEEDGNRVMIRLYQSVLNMTTKEIMADPAEARRLYEATLGSRDRIKVFHNSPLHRRDIEKAIEKHDPDLIMFNILGKVNGFSNKRQQSDVDMHAAQALWMRELANGYEAAAVTAWQAGSDAHGKPWIEQADMYGSKTAVTGEADLIIGIGKSLDTTGGTSSVPENHRYIHLSKNKLIGDSKTVESLRHGYFNAVYIDTERGRFYE